MKNDIIIFLAKYLVFIVALIGLAYWVRLNKSKKTTLAATIVIAAVLAMAVAKLIGKLYYDPRPFVTSHIKPLISHGSDNGFPSEHTTLSMVIATGVYFFNRRLGLGLFVLAVLVGLGRIWAHVHSPIDILGGLVIGSFAGLVGYFVANHFWPEQPLAKQATKKTSS